MSVTGSERLELFTRRVLGAVDLGQRWRDPMEDAIRRHTKAYTTGHTATDDLGAWFASVAMSDGAGANHLDFGAMYGVDGKGNLISVLAGNVYTDEVPFEDTAVTTYYVSVRVGEVPQDLGVNLSSGDAEYDYREVGLSDIQEPTVVVDNGATITFTLGNHDYAGTDDHTGRTAIIWLVDPVSPDAVTAIETVVIVGTAATTVGLLGQSAVSTTGADYRVAIMGPVITKSDISANTGYAHIGTVVGGGSPRTFNDSGQSLIMPLTDVTSTFNDLLTEGWITVPTWAVGGGSADIDVTSVGSVYNGGLITATTADNVTWAYVTSRVWISYNPATLGFDAYDDYDNATSASKVPFITFTVDGAGLVNTTPTGIHRRVQESNEPAILTVSSVADHRGAFRSLGEALAAAWSYQQLTASRSAVIQLVGDHLVTSTLGKVEHFPVGLTLKGWGSHRIEAFAAGVLTGGATVAWSSNAPLWDVPDGARVLDWKFEGIRFEYRGASTGFTNAVITCISNSGVDVRQIINCTFSGCTFAMNTDLVATTLAEPLPSVIHNGGTNADDLVGIVFENCDVWTEGAAIHSVSTIRRCHITNVKADQTGTTIPVGGHGGFIYCEGLIEDLHVSHSRFDDMNDWVIESQLGFANIWITDNVMEAIPDADTGIIKLVATSGDSSHGLWIHDNKMDVTYSGTSTAAVVHIVPDESGDADGNSIFIHSNWIRGDALTSATHEGIYIANVSSSRDYRGVVIFGNYVGNVGIGIDLDVDDAVSGVGDYVSVFGNLIRAGTYAIDIDDVDNAIIMGNVLNTSELAATLVSGAGATVNVLGNIMHNNGGASTAVDTLTGHADWVVLGNNYDGTPDFMNGFGATSMIAGNLLTSSASIITTISHSDTVILGNSLFSGDVSLTNVTDAVVVGNSIGGTYTGVIDDSTVVGNAVEGAFSESGTHNAITGNVLDGTVAIPGAGVANALVGNYIDGACVITGDDNVLVGNYFLGNLNTAATADENTIVANNYRTGTYTDGGTNTFNASNNSI